MTQLGLFAAIGGFELAAQWAGWKTVAVCEWDKFCQKVLKYYFPDAEQFGDIRTTDFTRYAGKIDVLTGGFPCQPYSTAGKRLGKEDERHLWPEMFRAIREVKPRWVVGENVRGLVNWNGGMVFDEVQSDLEAAGYEVLPFILPACGVDAPHRRDRIWFIAHAASMYDRGNAGEFSEKNGRQEWNNIPKPGSTGEVLEFTSYADSARRGQHYTTSQPVEPGFGGWRGNDGLVANTESSNGKLTGHSWQWWGGFADVCCNASDPTSGRRVQIDSQSKSGFTTQNIPDWREFPTQPPVCSRNDGVSPGLVGITVSRHRRESLKAYGNAIVPQVALQIFKAINEYENTSNTNKY